MNHYLVYWEWHHGGRPAPTLVEAGSKTEAIERIQARWGNQVHLRKTPEGKPSRMVLDVIETDPSKWPVCSCHRWFVSDKHSVGCPAYGNTEGTWIVPTRPQGVL